MSLFLILFLFIPSLSFAYTNRAAEELSRRWHILAQNELQVRVYPKALWWLKLADEKEVVLHAVLEQQKNAVTHYMDEGLAFYRKGEAGEAKIRWTIASQLAGDWWPSATGQIQSYLKELALYENR